MMLDYLIGAHLYVCRHIFSGLSLDSIYGTQVYRAAKKKGLPLLK